LREEEVGSWRSLRCVGILLTLYLLLLCRGCFTTCRRDLKAAVGVGKKVGDSREVVDVAAAVVSGLDDRVGVADVRIQEIVSDFPKLRETGDNLQSSNQWSVGVRRDVYRVVSIEDGERHPRQLWYWQRV